MLGSFIPTLIFRCIVSCLCFFHEFKELTLCEVAITLLTVMVDLTSRRTADHRLAEVSASHCNLNIERHPQNLMSCWFISSTNCSSCRPLGSVALTFSSKTTFLFLQHSSCSVLCRFYACLPFLGHSISLDACHNRIIAYPSCAASVGRIDMLGS